MWHWFIAYDLKSTLPNYAEARGRIDDALEGFEKASRSVRALAAEAGSGDKVIAVLKVFREESEFIERLDIVLGVRRSLDTMPAASTATKHTFLELLADQQSLKEFVKSIIDEADLVRGVREPYIAEIKRLRRELAQSKGIAESAIEILIDLLD